jgi:hypothetical protein
MGMTKSERKLLAQIGWALDRIDTSSGLVKALVEFDLEDQRRAEAKAEPAPDESAELVRQREAFKRIQHGDKA